MLLVQAPALGSGGDRICSLQTMPTSLLIQVSFASFALCTSRNILLAVDAANSIHVILAKSPSKSSAAPSALGWPAGVGGPRCAPRPIPAPQGRALISWDGNCNPGQPLAHDFKRGTPCAAHADFKGKQDPSIPSREERASIIFMWHFKGGGSEAAGDKGRRRG